MKTDNELIAEFMGVYETKDSFDSYGHDIPCYYTDNGIYRTRTLTVPGKTFSDFCKAAQYHTSWDWLMPVVDKIESLRKYYSTRIHFNADEGIHFCDIVDVDNYERACQKSCISKITAVYKAVVQFIKWYNNYGK